MDKHEQKAREITENWWHESWKHYGPDVLNEAIAEALRDTSRDAKAEVLREMMEPSEEALAAAHEAVRSATRTTSSYVKSGILAPGATLSPAIALRAMLKAFASESGIDLEEVETNA